MFDLSLLVSIQSRHMSLQERRFKDVETSLNIPPEYLDNLFHGKPIHSHRGAEGSVLLATYPQEFIASVLAFLTLHKTRFSKYGYARWMDSLTSNLNLRLLPREFDVDRNAKQLRDMLIPNKKILQLPDYGSLSEYALWHGKNNGPPTPTLLQQITEVRRIYPHMPIVFGMESDGYIQAVGQKPFADQNFRASLALSINGDHFDKVLFIDTPQDPSRRADYWRDAYRRLRPKMLIAPDDELLFKKRNDLPDGTEIHVLRTVNRVSQSDLRKGRLSAPIINIFQQPNRELLASTWNRCPDCGI